MLVYQRVYDISFTESRHHRSSMSTGRFLSRAWRAAQESLKASSFTCNRDWWGRRCRLLLHSNTSANSSGLLYSFQQRIWRNMKCPPLVDIFCGLNYTFIWVIWHQYLHPVHTSLLKHANQSLVVLSIVFGHTWPSPSCLVSHFTQTWFFGSFSDESQSIWTICQRRL